VTHLDTVDHRQYHSQAVAVALETIQEAYQPASLKIRCVDPHEADAELYSLLQKHERVHAMHTEKEVSLRLGPLETRRCYTLSHESSPDYPAAFTFVALSDNVPTNIQAVLAHSTPPPLPTDTASALATFYSISATQSQALKGLSLGQLLLKGAMEDLRTSAGVQQFFTLSPIPTFVLWLSDPQTVIPHAFLTVQQVAQLRGSIAVGNYTALEDHRAELMALLRHYLEEVLVDPVYNFHCTRNHAQLHRVNWEGDSSEHGLARSLGLMVNYRYS
jgi:malonyl-CoA decarboxylase